MLEELRALIPSSRPLIPLLIVLALATGTLLGTRALLRIRDRRQGTAFPFRSQVIMLTITGVSIVVALLSAPIAETTRGQLLGLLGIVLTGMIAFASTTFVANAMAGLMLRAVGNFRAGDWVRVGEQFGRVTERGLFHTEIQTEHRDLATLPNLYLVTNPVVVIRESGTIVSASLSLGYDHHHADLESLLIDAARGAQLEDPFVQVLELGDFSVTYRVSGFLTEVKQLLTARSRLRMHVLDTLHGAGVEIVSPNFMNQRQLPPETRVVPTGRARAAAVRAPEAPEEKIFDKADERAALEELPVERGRLQQEIAGLEAVAKAGTPAEKAAAEAEIERRRTRLDEIAEALAQEAKPENSGAGDATRLR